MLVAFGLAVPAAAQQSTSQQDTTTETATSKTAKTTVVADTTQPDADGSFTLAPIVVKNELAYSGEIDGYLASASRTAFKGGVPIAEVPQSLSVVTSTELKDRQPKRVDDAIKYVVGVEANNWGDDPRYDQFSMRGFDLGTSSLYRDGLPEKSLGMNGFQIDPYMLERIDVLRGPAGVLYGSNDAGGMVNLVTKRPVFHHLAEVETGYSAYGTKTLSFDVSDTLNKSGTLAGRLTGLTRDGSTAEHGSKNDRSFLAGGLTWAPSADTSITVLAHIQRDSVPQLIGIPIAGEDYDASLGELPSDFYKNQSDYNLFTSEQRSVGWDAMHKFSDNVIFTQKFRYAYQRTHSRQLDFSYGDTDGLHYYPYDLHDRAETYGMDNNLEFRQQFAGGKNSVVTGFDIQKSWASSLEYYGDADYIVDPAAPSFAAPVTGLSLYDDTRDTYTETGLYVQDHLKLDNGLTATAGLRHSWLKSTTQSLVYGTSDSQKDQATTGLLGLTYDMGNGITPYISYTEGFTQNVGSTIDGQALKPSKSRQWEAGLRYHPAGRSMQLSAAIYDLRKTNVKDYDLNDPTYSTFTQAGEIRSRGLELALRGRLADRLQGVVNYTYLDSTITHNADTSLIGNTSAFAPRNQISAWLDYDASRLLPGLGFGAGVHYISGTYDSQENLRRTPSYTLADMAVHYTVDQFRINLNVTNLFNRKYYGTCIEDYGCIRGKGRIVSLSVSRSF